MNDEPDFTIITVKGGFAGLEREHAKSGELRWERGERESVAEFRARVETDARAAGCTQIVFGGLPR